MTKKKTNKRICLIEQDLILIRLPACLLAFFAFLVCWCMWAVKVHVFLKCDDMLLIIKL